MYAPLRVWTTRVAILWRTEFLEDTQEAGVTWTDWVIGAIILATYIGKKTMTKLEWRIPGGAEAYGCTIIVMISHWPVD